MEMDKRSLEGSTVYLEDGKIVKFGKVSSVTGLLPREVYEKLEEGLKKNSMDFYIKVGFEAHLLDKVDATISYLPGKYLDSNL